MNGVSVMMVIVRIAWPIDALQVHEPGWLVGWMREEHTACSTSSWSSCDIGSGRDENQDSVDANDQKLKSKESLRTGSHGCNANEDGTLQRRSATVTVVGIIPKRVVADKTTIIQFLDSVNSSESFQRVKSYCDGALVLLGEWLGKTSPEDQRSHPSILCEDLYEGSDGRTDNVNERGRTDNVWIVLEPGQLTTKASRRKAIFGESAPALRRGVFWKQVVEELHILMYERRRLDRFEYYSNSLLIYQQHHGTTDFELLLHQLNVSPIILELLKGWLKTSFAVSTTEIYPVEAENTLPPQNRMLINEVLNETASSRARRAGSHFLSGESHHNTFISRDEPQEGKIGVYQALKWAALQPIIALILLLRIYAEVIMSFFNIQVPLCLPFFGGKKLRQISVLGKLLDRKCREYCVWPSVLILFRRATGHKHARQCYWESPHAAASHHIAVYSSMYLAMLDVVLGLCLGAYLMLNSFESGPVLRGLHNLVRITHIEVLKNNIEWLMGVPAGFKFNRALSYRLGCINMEAINAWDTITTLLTPWEPVIVLVLGTCGIFGITLIFALTTDILNFATFHISLLRSIFARIHAFNLSLLASLWRLLRGKKWNVLRGRVDSAEFDTSELLMGTLLFACIFFLFTTWFIYYAFFSFLWLFVLSIRTALWTLMAILNRFPFYALYMKFRYPNSMPRETVIQLIGTVTRASTLSSTDCANLCMEVVSSPARIQEIFHVYADVLRDLKKHYNPAKILLAALKGDEVSQAPEFTGDFDLSMLTPNIPEYTNAVIQLLR